MLTPGLSAIRLQWTSPALSPQVGLDIKRLEPSSSMVLPTALPSLSLTKAAEGSSAAAESTGPAATQRALEFLTTGISRAQANGNSQAIQRLLNKNYGGATSLTAEPTGLPAASISQNGPLPRLSLPAADRARAPQTFIPTATKEAGLLTPRRLLKWAPLAGLAVIGIAQSGVPWLTVLGWAANSLFIFAPWVQIVENFRNIRARQKGGEEARVAIERLAGVSAASQLAQVAGNLFNFPTFLTSASPVLIGNSLLGAGNAMIILAQLAWTRHFSRRKMGLVTAAALGTIFVAAPLIMGHAAIAATLGLAATAAFSVFTVPQILQNQRDLAALRLPGQAPTEVQAALERLRGIKPLYLLAGMIGNMLFLPISLVSGRWYNAATVIIGIVGPIIVLRQLAGASLFPKLAWALLAAGAAAYGLGILAVAAIAPSLLGSGHP